MGDACGSHAANVSFARLSPRADGVDPKGRMTDCPNCNHPLPQGFTGTACPSCRKPLTPSSTSVRARELTPAPSEDRWDLADAPAPVDPPSATTSEESPPVEAKPLPSSAGVPGAAMPARRLGGATMVMGKVSPTSSTAKPPAKKVEADEWAIDDAPQAPESKQAPEPEVARIDPAAEGLRFDQTLSMNPNIAREIAAHKATLALSPTPSATAPASTMTDTPPPSASPSSAGISGVAPRRTAGATLVGHLDSPGTENLPLADAPAATVPSRPARASDTSGRRNAAVSHAATAPTVRDGAPVIVATNTSRHRQVLASDVLREDLAPQEPASQTMRIVLAVAGALITALAVRSFADFSQALAWAIPGLTALVVALAPISYGTRALLAFAPASTALATQALAFPGTRVPAAIAFVATAGFLPAALFFRSFFRASRRARAFVVRYLNRLSDALFEAGNGVWAIVHAPAIALIGVSLLSLLAFMGADTTAGCRAWATLAIAWAGFVGFAHHAPHVGLSGIYAAWANGIATASLAAISAITGAALLALYARPREPRTGIGAAASQH